MRYLWTIFALIIGLVSAAPSFGRDIPGRACTQRLDYFRVGAHSGDSPFEPPPKTDTTFVVDSDTGLDTDCVFRNGGPLIFHIVVDRYVGPVDGSGYLIDPQGLIDKGIISSYAVLRMPAWDVDYDGGGSTNYPERDRILFNGQVVPGEFLTGENETWKENYFQIPIRMIRFPADPGKGGTITPVENEIEIDIDVLNTDEIWCTAIDWAALSIQAARPVLMLHGILSGGDGWKAVWVKAFKERGLPSVPSDDDTMDMGKLDSIENNALKISAKVEEMKNRWGVQKVNMVCHSKGGLDARHYAEHADTVDKIIQIGTPNAGSIVADYIQGLALSYTSLTSLLLMDLAMPAGIELTVGHMALYNALHSFNPQVTYLTMGGIYTGGTTSWLNWLIPGDDDDVVPLSSVQALSFTVDDTITSSGNTLDARHFNGQVNSSAIFSRMSPKLLSPTITSVMNELVLGENEVDRTAAAVIRRGEKQVPTRTVEQAAATGIPMTSAAGSVKQGSTKSYAFQVDESAMTRFTLCFGAGDLSLALVTPSGKTIDPNTYGNFAGVSYSASDIEGFNWRVYSLAAPQTGTWKLKVKGVKLPSGVTEEPFILAEWGQTAGVTLKTQFQRSNIHSEDPLVVLGTFSGPSGPILGAEVQAKIALPDGTIKPLPLLDDGTGGDATAGDGVYTGTFSGTTQPGTYKVTVDAASSNPKARRIDFQLATVSASSSTISGPYQDSGEDTNDNGLLDNLIVGVGLNITHQGVYRLFGRLVDSNGQTVIETSTTIELEAGTSRADLRFPGETLFQQRINGPYTVSVLRLAEDVSGDIRLLDEQVNPHRTASYSYMDFEHSNIFLTGTASSKGADDDSDGKFEYLDIRVEVNVDVASSFGWSAILLDKNGKEVGFFSSEGDLDAGNNTLEFLFDGTAIGKNGVSGSFKLANLLIYDHYSSSSLSVFDVYSTKIYTADKFEGYVKSTVKVVALVPNAAEPKKMGKFKIIRTGNINSPLQVNYTMSGTAKNGVDYKKLSGSVRIPAQKNFALVNVIPIDDKTVEKPEKVRLTLKAGASYTLVKPTNAAVTIKDND